MTWQISMMIFNWQAFLTHYYDITPECKYYFLSYGVLL